MIDDYQVDVNFDAGSGSRFYPGLYLIVLDIRIGHFSAAVTLVHEVEHARFFHQGLTSNGITLERDIFIEGKIEEEVSAVNRSIQATKELWEAGVEVRQFRPALYYPYMQAYLAAVRVVRSANPTIDEAAIQVFGHTAGSKVVSQAFLKGDLVTTVSQDSYIDYWGSIWDRSYDPSMELSG